MFCWAFVRNNALDREKENIRRGGTNTSIMLRGILRRWCITSADVGKEVIPDDGVDRLETFAGGFLLVLSDDSVEGTWERRGDWSRGGSNRGHEWAEVGGVGTIGMGVRWRPVDGMI
jgi:hypothetical protein